MGLMPGKCSLLCKLLWQISLSIHHASLEFDYLVNLHAPSVSPLCLVQPASVAIGFQIWFRCMCPNNNSLQCYPLLWLFITVVKSNHS